MERKSSFVVPFKLVVSLMLMTIFMATSNLKAAQGAQFIIQSCDLASCGKECRDAYKEKLISFKCQKLPPYLGNGSVCECLHKPAAHNLKGIKATIVSLP